MVAPLILRADAGPTIGVGHVMRCLALAQAWHDRGGQTHLVSGELPLRVARRVRGEGVVVHVHDRWLQTAEVVRLAVELRADWVVVDGYGLGADLQRGIRAAGARVMAIDDHACAGSRSPDALLDQNLGARASNYPEELRSADLLLGTRYALLRREFSREVESRDIRAVGARLLVTVGGGEVGGLMWDLVGVLGQIPLRNLEVRVVVGPAVAMRSGRERSAGGSKVSFVHDPPDLWSLMEWADLAITAAGSTVWEAARMGLPSLVFDLADNQRPVARQLEVAGIAVHQGGPEAMRRGDTAHRITELLKDQRARREMSRLGRYVVDGCGASRVAAYLGADPSPRAATLRARAVNRGDIPLLWEWANDPETRRAAFSQETISWRDHVAWCERPAGERFRRHFLVERTDMLPVGQVRFDMIPAGDVEIDVSVAPEQRGRGLGKEVIAAGLRAVKSDPDLSRIVAQVKSGNTISQQAFLAAGFTLAGHSRECGEDVVRMVYTRERS